MRSEKSMEFHDPSRIPGADGRDNNLPDVQGRENESGCAHAPYSVLMSVYQKEESVPPLGSPWKHGQPDRPAGGDRPGGGRQAFRPLV